MAESFSLESQEPQDQAPATCSLCRSHAPGQLEPIPGTNAHACPSCFERMRHYPLPQWVRTLYGVAALLVASGALYNARFVSAYVQMRRARAAMAQGNLDAIAQHFDSASKSVPESRELAGLRDAFGGFVLVRDERSAEAIPMLSAAQAVLPNDKAVTSALESARAGVAFERKDWDEFLRIAREHEKSLHNQQSAMEVASALACKYAETGEDSYRTASLQNLERAVSLGNHGAVQEYERRIRHRLQTREILGPREFARRFPNGWQE